MLVCSSCTLQGIHILCSLTDAEGATAIPESWECDICMLVSQRQESSDDETMTKYEHKEGRVVLPGETYSRLVQQCKRRDNLSINLKRL